MRGKPGWPPSRLALVTVFQKAEDLTDRQAAECVGTRIDWKYALGLDLADPGFDHSVLSEFRARVAGGGLDQVVLDTLLEQLAAGGLVGAGGKMRTDSTHVISAVRDVNRGGAGRGVGAGLPGGPGGGRAAGGGTTPGRLVGHTVCRKDRYLADACLPDEEGAAGAGLRV